MPDDEELLTDERGQYVLDLGPLGYRQPQGRAPHRTAGIATSSMSEDWYTAPDVVAAARQLYGGVIDLDPMSCPEANEVVGAREIFTAADDGLVREWHGNLLMNPPWNNSGRAVAKLLSEREAGHVRGCVTVLNANSMTSRWFAPLLAFPICLPSYRIRHYAPRDSGRGKSSPSTGTVIVFVHGYKRGYGGALVPDPSLVPRFADIFSDLGAILTTYRPASARAASKASAAASEASELDW
jgi:DNA N-6-adenine-methyltransferase (Dam)